MAEQKFTIDGKTHTYDPDPPGCLDKIIGVIIMIVILVLVIKGCLGV